MPDEIAYNYLSFVDDINYLMELKEKKKQDAVDMFTPDDDKYEDENENADDLEGGNGDNES